jgi:hypothetical protein
LDPRGEPPSPLFSSLSIFLSLPCPSLCAPSFLSHVCAPPAAPRARPPTAPARWPPDPSRAVPALPRGGLGPRRRGPPPPPCAWPPSSRRRDPGPCARPPAPCARRPDPRRRGSLAPLRPGPGARPLPSTVWTPGAAPARVPAWLAWHLRGLAPPRSPNTFPRAQPHARGDLFLFF